MAASQTPESKQSATHIYRLEVATVATQALNPEFGQHEDYVKGAVTMKFRLDRRGQLHDLRVSSSISDRWIEDTTKRILSGAKFPPIPQAVITELGHDTIDIETLWIPKSNIVAPNLPTVTGAELFDYGTYQTVATGKSVRARDTAAKTWDVTPFATLLKKTDVIHVRGKTDFGIRYRLTGKQGAAPAYIRVQLVHPPTTNPKTGKSVSVESYKVYVGMGQLDYRGYLFEEQWQMVPGTWTFQLYSANKLVLEKPFQVIVDK